MRGDGGVFVPVLADFAGGWTIARRIADRMGGQDGTFTGIARFRPAEGGVLSYVEEGGLRLGAHPAFHATRRYLWRTEGGRIVVDHGDGRPFHSFDPAAPEAEHVCGADIYAVRYDFSDWPGWRAEWSVRGPRKDYTMVSEFMPGAG